jgi:hypothetical protein
MHVTRLEKESLGTHSSYTGGRTLGSSSLYQLPNGLSEAEFSVFTEKEAISLKDHDAARVVVVLDACLALVLRKEPMEAIA